MQRSGRNTRGLFNSATIARGEFQFLPLRHTYAEDDGLRYVAAASLLLRRALRRLAALRWMIPRLAALSIAEMTRRISSAFGAGAERIGFCRLRRCALTLRFRSARLCVWRERLAADLVLAIADENFCESRIPPRAIPTSVCSMQASSSAGRRQALRPSAFVLR